MQGDASRSTWRLARRAVPALVAGLLSGCALARPPLDRALMARAPAADAGAAESYAVACPDVLQVAVDTRPDLGGKKPVGADGCVGLDKLGRIPVEGLTASAAAVRVAEAVRVPPAWVRVQVAEYNSKQIFLIGEVVGAQRAVPYRGPETVLDLLRRAGGITAGAAPDQVYVVRARVAEGGEPEVFAVDLRAILLQSDARTNVVVRPFDQVHVGETRQCRMEKSLPPWLRPAFARCCGLSRPASDP